MEKRESSTSPLLAVVKLLAAMAVALGLFAAAAPAAGAVTLFSELHECCDAPPAVSCEVVASPCAQLCEGASHSADVQVQRITTESEPTGPWRTADFGRTPLRAARLDLPAAGCGPPLFLRLQKLLL